MKIERDCGVCHGVGEVPAGNGKWKKCGNCGGNGTVTTVVPDRK